VDLLEREREKEREKENFFPLQNSDYNVSIITNFTIVLFSRSLLLLSIYL